MNIRTSCFPYTAMNSTYRAIIVDDEANARVVLHKLISRHCPQLEVCADAGTVGEALAAIDKHRPAIVFLDVDRVRAMDSISWMPFRNRTSKWFSLRRTTISR